MRFVLLHVSFTRTIEIKVKIRITLCCFQKNFNLHEHSQVPNKRRVIIDRGVGKVSEI